MGVVYRARQLSLDREVALKVIRPEQLLFPGVRERFQREVEIIARLQHEGIVQLYSFGEERGIPWFAMERIRGC
jgi:serine/threonine-protein kinase